MNSEQFPNRPKHPDFALLSEVALDCDAIADADPTLSGAADLIGRVADGESVAYMAVQRATMAAEQDRLSSVVPSRTAALRRRHMVAGAWADGFVIGSGFNALKLLQVPSDRYLTRIVAQAEAAAGHGDGSEEQVREAIAGAVAQAFALGHEIGEKKRAGTETP